jgi:hypothetical protein
VIATGAVASGGFAATFVFCGIRPVAPNSKAVIAIAAAKVTILEVLMAASETLLIPMGVSDLDPLSTSEAKVLGKPKALCPQKRMRDHNHSV